MRHVRMLGLCLVAVMACAAIAATSASALPEFGQCFEQPEHLGKYTNSVCTAKAKVNKTTGKTEGQFEWRKAEQVTNRKFTGASVAESHPVLTAFFDFCVRGDQHINPFCSGEERPEEHLGPVAVECESEKNSGEIATSKTLKSVVAKFFGCKIFGSAPCQNTTQEGEIDVNTLKGSVGFINKSAKPREAGILLEPASKKGLFAQFNCADALTTKVGAAPGTTNEKGFYAEKGGGDGIISTIAPVNTMTTEYSQVFSENGEFENVPSKFEGAKPLKVLESLVYNTEEPEFQSAWSRASETLTNSTILNEAGELKAN